MCLQVCAAKDASHICAVTAVLQNLPQGSIATTEEGIIQVRVHKLKQRTQSYTFKKTHTHTRTHTTKIDQFTHTHKQKTT